MKMPCNVIQDLLPLYADDACSEESRDLVREHLQECNECGRMLERLKSHEIETDLQSERENVIEYGLRRFRRRSATVGSAVSGVFMVPILVFLIINLISGSAMGWFFILLAAMAVAASLIVVPLMVPENKAFWTFCAFTASLIALLGVICLVTRGDWFWIASGAVLFGLSVFDFFDYITSNIMLPIGGLLLAVFAGWRLRRANFLDELTNSGKLKIPRWISLTLYYLVKLVAPIGILLIFLNTFFS